jgi:hypothetical protein
LLDNSDGVVFGRSPSNKVTAIEDAIRERQQESDEEDDRAEAENLRG